MTDDTPTRPFPWWIIGAYLLTALLGAGLAWYTWPELIGTLLGALITVTSLVGVVTLTRAGLEYRRTLAASEPHDRWPICPDCQVRFPTEKSLHRHWAREPGICGPPGTGHDDGTRWEFPR